MISPCDDFEGEAPNLNMLGPALEIDDLRTLRTEHAVISAWRLDEEELAKIQRTGIIYLAVLGQGMPPVALSTDLAGLKELRVDY